MVGLSVILEGYYKYSSSSNNSCSIISQVVVVNKASRMRMMKTAAASCSPSRPSSSPFSNNNPFSKRNTNTPGAGFLDCCFLCKQKLLPGKDIYMYKGDTAFCSVECRCRQIFMDEEDAAMALKPPKHKTGVPRLLSLKS